MLPFSHFQGCAHRPAPTAAAFSYRHRTRHGSNRSIVGSNARRFLCSVFVTITEMFLTFPKWSVRWRVADPSFLFWLRYSTRGCRIPARFSQGAPSKLSMTPSAVACHIGRSVLPKRSGQTGCDPAIIPPADPAKTAQSPAPTARYRTLRSKPLRETGCATRQH